MLQAYYQNPIAKNGDFADPFALRWNGRYYLYCTNPDLRCWSSADLVHWRPEGPVIGPDVFPGLVPFAPEVVYSDGKFYLYTSPSGFGHYVLESERPTGPFRKISEMWGMRSTARFSLTTTENGTFTGRGTRASGAAR